MKVRERVSAGEWMPPWLRYQHTARYEWAAQFCAGRRVLDAACANGYGAATLLARGAASVLALDIDPGTLAEGRQIHRSERLMRICGDATQLPLRDGAVDAFVSFETIEHVRDDARYAREARRIVRDGGTFICSTPNRTMTNPGTSIDTAPFNRFHLREYTRAELAAVLGAAFETIEWYGQSFFGTAYGSLLQGIGRRAHMAAVRLHQVRKLAGAAFDDAKNHWPAPLKGGREPEVLLAVCR